MELKKIEIEIVRLMGKQLSSREIGEVLGLSARTIEDYKGEMFKKVRVKNAIGMILYAVKQGIVKVKMQDTGS